MPRWRLGGRGERRPERPALEPPQRISGARMIQRRWPDRTCNPEVGERLVLPERLLPSTRCREGAGGGSGIVRPRRIETRRGRSEGHLRGWHVHERRQLALLPRALGADQLDQPLECVNKEIKRSSTSSDWSGKRSPTLFSFPLASGRRRHPYWSAR